MGIWTAANLGWTSGAKVGVGCLLAGTGFSCGASDQLKREVVDSFLPLYQKLGVERLPASELRKTVFNSLQSVENVVLSGPLFYIAYQLLHPEKGVKMSHHVIRSVGRGFNGNLASIPALLAFYGVAAVAIPAVREQLLKRGYSEKEAKERAEGGVILSAAPGEVVVEAIGCQVRPLSMTLPTALFATALTAGRLASGVLVQMQAVTSDESHSEEVKQKNFAKTLVLTTLFQHGIFGAMEATKAKAGAPGMLRYMAQGAVASGEGSVKKAALRFAGTGMQRFFFVLAWNELSHMEVAQPKWVDGDIEE